MGRKFTVSAQPGSSYYRTDNSAVTAVMVVNNSAAVSGVRLTSTGIYNGSAFVLI